MSSNDDSSLSKLVKIASGLPWSDSNQISSGLQRFLIEHIMMTSVGELVAHLQIQEMDPSEMKRKVEEAIESVQEKSGVRLRHLHDLVDLYVDSVLSNPTRTP